MWVSLLLALFSANSRLLMSFRQALYLLICSLMTSSTHLQGREQDQTHRVSSITPLVHNRTERVAHARCGFADVLDALQRVGGVGAAKDTGSKHDGKGVG